MFSTYSFSESIKIDVDDLKKNTSYEGGYHFAHKVIRWFWEVVSDFSPAEKRALLKYATSCSRVLFYFISILILKSMIKIK